MNDHRPDYETLKKRLDDDLAAGKTVVLGSSELDDPDVRLRLPQLLEQLAQTHQRQPLSPLKLPGYTLLGEIGRGGMSAVHLARHEALGRTVAVKVTPNWLASDPRSRERLVKEARSLALVNHPNIVRVYDIIESDEAFAIAMEWVDGHTLARLLRALPTTPGAEDMTALREKLGTAPRQTDALEATVMRTFVRMMRDIALATQAVHDAGLLHLDIKPSNVLVRRDGTPLLADFGVVRELASEQTHTHTFAGTPIYAAPEQLRRDDEHIGPYSDVYAIGLTLYELLAREQPLRDLDMASITKTVESGRFPPLSRFVNVPADLANIVQMAIAPEPGNRYASAAALAADLSAFLEDRPVVARPLSRSQRMRRWVRSEPWKATLAAALLVLVPVLLGLGGYLAWQWPQLERIRVEGLRAEANRLKNEAFQNLLFRHAEVSHNNHLLAKAVELDDGATAAACRLLYANHTHSREIPALLAQCAQRAVDNQALRLFEAMQAADRLYFDEHEVEQLRRSSDPLDHYILAIDRVLLAFDSSSPLAHRQAAASLEAALLIHGSDELLHGLLVWSNYQRPESERSDGPQRALERFRPDDATALTWLAGSQIEARSPAGEATLQRLEQLAPDSVVAYSTRMRQLLLAHQWHQVLEFDRRARRAGISSPSMVSGALTAHGQLGTTPTMAVLGELLPRWAPAYEAVSSTIVRTPHRAMDLIRRMLASNRTAGAIEAMYRACDDRGHPWGVRHLQDHILQLMPDRRMMDVDLMDRLLQDVLRERRVEQQQKHLARAVPIARRWRQGAGEGAAVPAQMIILTTAAEWQALNEAARYWFEVSDGEDRTHAASYVALAESRLGNNLAAAEFSSIALSASLSKAAWTHAWLEAAWLHIDPQSPARLQDPELAMFCMRRFQQLNEQRLPPFRARGPWINYVQAEVYAAHADQDARNLVNARRLVDSALHSLEHGPPEPGAPAPERVRQMLESLDKRLPK